MTLDQLKELSGGSLGAIEVKVVRVWQREKKTGQNGEYWQQDCVAELAAGGEIALRFYDREDVSNLKDAVLHLKAEGKAKLGVWVSDKGKVYVKVPRTIEVKANGEAVDGKDNATPPATKPTSTPTAPKPAVFAAGYTAGDIAALGRLFWEAAGYIEQPEARQAYASTMLIAATRERVKVPELELVKNEQPEPKLRDVDGLIQKIKDAYTPTEDDGVPF